MEEITAQLIKTNYYLSVIATMLIIIPIILLFFYIIYWTIRKE